MALSLYNATGLQGGVQRRVFFLFLFAKNRPHQDRPVSFQLSSVTRQLPSIILKLPSMALQVPSVTFPQLCCILTIARLSATSAFPFVAVKDRPGVVMCLALASCRERFFCGVI